jgi:hypothetical protein
MVPYEWVFAVPGLSGTPIGDAAALFLDRLADDLRGALGWASNRSEPERRADAHDLAFRLARLAFDHGLPSESQRRFIQAPALASDDAAASEALHRAAGAALCRLDSREAAGLNADAAEAARRADDPFRDALEPTCAADLICRAAGIVAELPPPGTAEEEVAGARRIASDDGRGGDQCGADGGRLPDGVSHESKTQWTRDSSSARFGIGWGSCVTSRPHYCPNETRT